MKFRTWGGWIILALGLLASIALVAGIRALRPLGHPATLRGVPEGYVLSIPVEEVDQFHEMADRSLSESDAFDPWKTASYDPMPARGATIIRGLEDWPAGRAEIVKSSLVRAPVPRERIEFYARTYPRYRIHSWILSLEKVGGPGIGIYSFFVTAVLETPRGHFGKTVRFEGVSGWYEYEEEWLLEGGMLTFLKPYFPYPPTARRDPGGRFRHLPDLGLVIDQPRPLTRRNVELSVDEGPSLSVVGVYPGSPAAGSGIRFGDWLLALLTDCGHVSVPGCPRAMPASAWDPAGWRRAILSGCSQRILVYRPSLDEVATPRFLPHRQTDERWVRDPGFRVVRSPAGIRIQGHAAAVGWVWWLPKESPIHGTRSP